MHSPVSEQAKILADPLHPRDNILCVLPSGKQFRAIKTKTTRNSNSFYPQAVSLINYTKPLICTDNKQFAAWFIWTHTLSVLCSWAPTTIKPILLLLTYDCSLTLFCCLCNFLFLCEKSFIFIFNDYLILVRVSEVNREYNPYGTLVHCKVHTHEENI